MRRPDPFELVAFVLVMVVTAIMVAGCIAGWWHARMWRM
jgi:hypothetical protein